MRIARFLMAFAITLFTVHSVFAAGAHKTVTPRPLSQQITASRGSVQGGAGNISPTITWGMDAQAYYARDNGIYSKHGLSMTIRHDDNVIDQLNRVISGEQAYFRGTIGMGILADDALRGAGLELVPIVGISRSTGGDAIVVRGTVKNIADIRKIAVQYPGPHLDLMAKLFRDARRSLTGAGAPQVVYYPELTLPPPEKDTGDIVDPVSAFLNDSSFDAVMCIIPDVDLLTGTEGVQGARMLASTKTMGRVIYDLVWVRSDYLQNNRREVENFVRATLEAEEGAFGVYQNRTSSATAYQQLAGAMDKDFGLGTDIAGSMIGDGTFLNHNGNYHFFTGVGQTRNLANITNEVQGFFRDLGFLTRSAWTVTDPGWDWTSLGRGLKNVAAVRAPGQTAVAGAPAAAPRFNASQQSRLEALVTSRIIEPTSDADASGRLFQIEILFAPNQTDFTVAKYDDKFQEALSYIQTYDGAVVSFTGHADPRAMSKARAEFGSRPDWAQIQTIVKQRMRTTSMKRAETAMRRFIEYCRGRGFTLDNSNITKVGAGIEHPKHPVQATMTPNMNRENRRVVIELLQMEGELDDLLSEY